MSAVAPVVSAAAVGVRLGNRTVLDDVGFELPAGRLTGLIGANGAGKTTLLRVILGLQAHSGTVLVDGAPRRRGRPAIGYVPQRLTLDRDLPLRARDLIGLGLDGHRLGVGLPSRRRRELVQEAIEAVGASSFADARVGRLSGGEQQRVLIALALIGRPRLLLMDEPLAGLDVRSVHEVVALLGRVCSEHGVAVLLSAHEINPLLEVMEHVVYLAAGHAASGRAEEIVRSEVLSRLYGHHVDVLRVHGRVLVVSGTGVAAGEAPSSTPHVELLR